MNSINIPSLSFSDFLDEKKIRKLKEYFLQQDINFGSDSDIDIDQKTILFKMHFFEKAYFGEKLVENEYDKEVVEDILRLDYYDDFLLPALQLLPTNFDNYIRLRLKRIFGKEAKIDFFERLSDYLLETVDNIQESAHLKNIEIKLVETAFLCLDNVTQNLKEITSGKAVKPNNTIPFNLKKIEVLYLFEQMYRHNIIHKSMTRIKLFGLIDRFFTFSGNNKISGSYNSIQDYKDGRKRNEKVLNDLSNKFERIFSQ